MKKTSLLLISLFVLLFAACKMNFNGDLQNTIDEEMSTLFTFFNTNPTSPADDVPLEWQDTLYKIDSKKYASDFPTFKREGYHILGWQFCAADGTPELDAVQFKDAQSESGESYRCIDFLTVTPQPVRVYAIWDTGNPPEPEPEPEPVVPNTYTVTFMSNGKVVNEQTVNEGEYAQWFEFEWTKGDYEFRDWYYDEGTWEKWFDLYSTPIYEDTVVYARWVEVRYITYHRNDGKTYQDEWQNSRKYSCEMAPVYHDDGTTSYEWIAWVDDGSYMFGDSTNDTYFLGWSYTAGATTADIYAGDQIALSAQNIDLYAVWTTEYYTVTLVNSADRSQTFEKRIGKEAGKSARASLSNIYWETNWNEDAPYGYSFAYAFATADEVDTITEVTETQRTRFYDAQEISADTTYYVLWQLQVIGHGGWYWDDAQTNEFCNYYSYLYGQPISEPDTEKYGTPWRDHAVFTGWYTDADCTTPASFPLSADDAVQDEYGTYLHIYAGWEVEKYTVRFIYNIDGIDTEYATQEVPYGEKVTRPDDPQEDGWEFAGWYDGSLTTEFDFDHTTIEGETWVYGSFAFVPHLYVDAVNGDDHAGDDIQTLTGGKLHPFATLTRALDKIADASMNHGHYALDWTVHISGTVRDTAVIDQKEIWATSITIAGTNATTDILHGDTDADGTGDGSVLTVRNTSVPITLANLTITGGSAEHGAGIHIEKCASVTLAQGVLITGNTASANGGGVWNSASTLTVSGATITGNTAAQGGGLYNCADATLAVTGGTVSSNVASGDGGGIYNNGGTVTLSAGTVQANTAKNGGGLFAGGSGTVTLSGGAIINNTNSTAGAGVYIKSGATLSMTGGEISGNTASQNGGGVYTEGTFTMTGGEISGNTATQNGGAVYVASTMTMEGDAYIPAGDNGKNDVYLVYNLGGQKRISVDSALSRTGTVATITPQNYSATWMGVTFITAKVLEGSALASEYVKFAVTPQVSGGTTTYWVTQSNGYIKEVEALLSVTVTIPDDETGAQIPVKEEETDTHIIFSVDTSKESWWNFTWTLDDDVYTTSRSDYVTDGGATFTLSKNELVKGTYDLLLEAEHYDGAQNANVTCSYFAQIKVE